MDECNFQCKDAWFCERHDCEQCRMNEECRVCVNSEICKIKND